MSLIEVLLAIGLASVAGMVMLTLITDANKSQNNIRMSSDFQSSTDLARLAIMNASHDCQKTLRVGSDFLTKYSGTKASLDAIAAWRADAGTFTPVIEKKSYLGYQVQKMEIGEPLGMTQLSFEDPITGKKLEYKSYLTEITIEAKKNEKISLGVQVMNHKIPILILVGPDAQTDVVECSMTTDAWSSTCLPQCGNGKVLQGVSKGCKPLCVDLAAVKPSL